MEYWMTGQGADIIIAALCVAIFAVISYIVYMEGYTRTKTGVHLKKDSEYRKK